MRRRSSLKRLRVNLASGEREDKAPRMPDEPTSGLEEPTLDAPWGGRGSLIGGNVASRASSSSFARTLVLRVGNRQR